MEEMGRERKKKNRNPIIMKTKDLKRQLYVRRMIAVSNLHSYFIVKKVLLSCVIVSLHPQLFVARVSLKRTYLILPVSHLYTNLSFAYLQSVKDT